MLNINFGVMHYYVVINADLPREAAWMHKVVVFHQTRGFKIASGYTGSRKRGYDTITLEGEPKLLGHADAKRILKGLRERNEESSFMLKKVKLSDKEYQSVAPLQWKLKYGKALRAKRESIRTDMINAMLNAQRRRIA